MKYLKATLLGSGALASLLLSSVLLTGCQDEDFGYTSEEISAAAYKRNFEAMYGKIDPNQTWDFSAYALHQNGLIGGPDQTNPETRADLSGIEREQSPVDLGAGSDKIGVIVPTKYVLDPLVDPNTKAPSSASNAVHDDVISEWLNEHMTERQNHEALGTPFKLINDGGDFLIIPIYQGQSGMVWDLHLVDDRNNDYKIWHKSDGITYKEDYSLGKGEEFQYRQENANGTTINFLEDSKRGDDIVVESPLKNVISGTTLTREVKITFELPVYYDFSIDTYRKWNWIKGSLQYGDNTTIDVNLQYTGNSQDRGNDVLSKTITIPSGTDVNGLKFVMDKNSSYNASVHTYSATHVRVFVNYDYQSEVKTLKNYPNDIRNGENSISYFQGHTIFRHHVEAEAIKINSEKLGKDHSFYLYLDVVYSDNNNKDYALPDSKQRSDRNMMRALTSFTQFGGQSPINEKYLLSYVNNALGLNLSESNYLVVGCEDANGAMGDKDYNDVVLLIAGLPKRPTVATDVIEKRYMVEDLGSTFDFDFNDIVVDVKQAKIEGVLKQTATITHLCGTIPYQLLIDNTPFTPVMKGQNGSDQQGFDPQGEDFVFTITGWDPAKNNISILVWPDKKYESFDEQYRTGSTKPNDNGYQSTQYEVDTKGARQIKFPNAGDLPYIIAFDPEIRWRNEHESVPRAWFSTQSIINAWNQNTIGKTEVEKAVEEAIEAKKAEGWKVVDLTNGRYFTNAGITGTNSSNASNAVLNLTNFLIDNNYACSGTLELAMLLPEDAPAYSEVKGKFSCAQSAGTISDNYVHFSNFEVSDGALFKSLELKTSELLNLASRKSSELKLEIDYSTFGFTEPLNEADKNAYTRVLMKFTSFQNIDVSQYGTKYSYTNSNVTQSSNNCQVDLKPFFSSYNGEDIILTIVNPTSSNINGKISRGSTNQSEMLNANARSSVQCTITNPRYKNAINDNSQNLFIESYSGHNMFDSDLICSAQIYIKTTTATDYSQYGKEVFYANSNIEEYEQDQDTKFKRLQMKTFIADYDGSSSIEVTIVNKNSSEINGHINAGNNWSPVELQVYANTTKTISYNKDARTNAKSSFFYQLYNGSNFFDANRLNPARVFLKYDRFIVYSNFNDGTLGTGVNVTLPSGKNGSSNYVEEGDRGKVLKLIGAYGDGINSYDSQFVVNFGNPGLKVGDKVQIKFDYKASKNVSNLYHVAQSPNSYENNKVYPLGNLNFTTSWQTYNNTITVDQQMVGNTTCERIALHIGNQNGTEFYFDNVSVVLDEVE